MYFIKLIPGLRPVRWALFSSLAALFLSTAAHGQNTAAGVTEPFQDVVLSSSVPGRVARRLVKEGDTVKAGQTLVELEKRQEELEVARRKLVMESKAELDAAVARVENTRADFESTRKLFAATKSVSQDDLAKKELDYKLAVAEADKLKMSEEREVFEHQMAVVALNERVIASPLTGQVVQLARDVGEDCKAQEPVVRVVDTRQFYLVANVEARAGFALQPGQTVQVEVEAGRDKVKMAGRISFISPVVDPASGLLRVKVLCDNPDGRVKPGVAGTLQF
ncbi:MAG: efflux RND transporter periplasmic adaptor subunit [Verrucomicrobia bacterium]|nr:efflux RND transporter periplasmic adaptor subunit [Verrucomicrobiota bacterium]